MTRSDGTGRRRHARAWGPALLVGVLLPLVGGPGTDEPDLAAAGAAICEPGTEAIPPARPDHPWSCAHQDQPPPGVDLSAPVPLGDLLVREGASAAAAAAAEDAGVPTAVESVGDPTLVCEGDGRTGHRLQAIYAYPTGATDRYAALLDSLRRWAAGSDDVVNRSAALTGGVRRLRWVTTDDGAGGCVAEVIRLEVPASALATFSATIQHLRTNGFTATDRKYVVWADTTAAGICGVAQMYEDDRPEQHLNWNNGNHGAHGLVSRIDTPCWGFSNSVEIHEIAHMLGAVSKHAPHATEFGHCHDESDRMCYPDGTATPMRHVCPPAQEALLDCNGDDYFNTLPAPGSWLAGRWNAAHSRWLIGGGNGVTHGEPGQFRVTTTANNPTPPGLPTQARADVTVPAGTSWSLAWTAAPGCEILGSTTTLDTTVVCDAHLTTRRAATATLTTPLGTATSSVALVEPAGTRDLVVTTLLGGRDANPWAGCEAETYPVGARVIDAASDHPVRGLRITTSGFGLSSSTAHTTGNSGTFTHPTRWRPTGATTGSVATTATSTYPSSSASVAVQLRTPCRTTLEVTPPPASVASGDAVTVTGRVTSAETGTVMADRQVRITRSTGSTSTVTSVTTSSSGTFSHTSPAVSEPTSFSVSVVATTTYDQVGDGPHAVTPTTSTTVAPPPPPPGSTIFTDVAASSHYDAAVGWLAHNEITTGVTPTRYNPEGTVTRGQMVTFLWRLAGRPNPGDAPHFDDIDPTSALSAPTRWARLTGVTTGVAGGNRFAPAAPVTRGQMVTFLHRFAGQPPTTENREFSDVAPTAFSSVPTRWAREHAVTSGVTPTRFGPDSQLTRSQMALFLQRFALAPASRGSGSQPVVVR